MNKKEIAVELVAEKILLVRGRKVMLDRDLAEMYGVKTKVLLQSVKRNVKRFPEDFMYQITRQEVMILKSQNVTSRWGGRRYLPYVFTEQGVAMLSGVLHSKRAIHVNIAIMRAFVKLRHVLATHVELARKIQEHDHHIKRIFELLTQLLTAREKPKRKIGFINDRKAQYRGHKL